MTENILRLFQEEDAYTAGHSCRVAKIACILGTALNLCKKDMRLLEEASELHDLGKVRVDVTLLNKPGRLTDEEFAEIKKHTSYGYAMIQPEDAVVANIILSHHERFDGTGYPNGLAGDCIPFLSRVIAVADSLDAMGSDRCYRKALPWSVCVSEINRNEGKMYDPDVVHAFRSCQNEILKLFSHKQV